MHWYCNGVMMMMMICLEMTFIFHSNNVPPSSLFRFEMMMTMLIEMILPLLSSYYNSVHTAIVYTLTLPAIIIIVTIVIIIVIIIPHSHSHYHLV